MSLEVHIVTPERDVWSGEATMVVAHGIEGDVGILQGHAPMMIRLGISPIRIHTDADEVRAAVDGGFLHVTSEGDVTRVDVLATEAVLPHQIDRGREERRRTEMEERLRQVADDDHAREELDKAVMRLGLAPIF
ncbi:MAG: ATP synthase F1 subunit epsilon [Actinomycetota bacterium]